MQQKRRKTGQIRRDERDRTDQPEIRLRYQFRTNPPRNIVIIQSRTSILWEIRKHQSKGEINIEIAYVTTDTDQFRTASSTASIVVKSGTIWLVYEATRHVGRSVTHKLAIDRTTYGKGEDKKMLDIDSVDDPARSFPLHLSTLANRRSRPRTTHTRAPTHPTISQTQLPHQN